MKILALIPARSGSKSIPDKNICDLRGKPLIAHTIEQALACSYLNEVVVSTDSSAYQVIAKEWGASAPFLRPPEIAGDHSTDRDVFRHVLHYFAERDQHFDLLVNLRPTAPFRAVIDIDRAIEKMQQQKSWDSVRSMTRADGKHHPYWMYQLDEESQTKPFVPNLDISQYFQRQMLPPVYYLNGVVDVIRTNIVLHHEQLYGDSMGMIEVPAHRALDIDTPEDLQYANFLLTQPHNAAHYN